MILLADLAHDPSILDRASPEQVHRFHHAFLHALGEGLLRDDPKWARALDAFPAKRDLCLAVLAQSPLVHPLTLETAGIRLRQEPGSLDPRGMDKVYCRLREHDPAAAMRFLPTWLLALPRVEAAQGVTRMMRDVPSYASLASDFGSVLIERLSRTGELEGEEGHHVYGESQRLLYGGRDVVMLTWSLGYSIPKVRVDEGVDTLLHLHGDPDVRVQAATCQALRQLTRRHGVVVWDAVGRYLDKRTPRTRLFTLTQLVTRVIQT